MTTRRVLIIEKSCVEADEAAREILRRAVEAADAEAEVRRLPGVDEAVRAAAEEGWHADLVLVCQHWTREYTERDVLTLLRAFPLARIVCCYGPWCASDGRSGTAWPPAVRVPLDEAAARIRQEFEVLAGRCPPLPLTASRDEIFAYSGAEPERVLHLP